MQIKKQFTLENLGCANCAAKMEQKIKSMPEILDATIVFATKQLRITMEKDMDIQEKLQEICASIEEQVKVVEKKEKKQEYPKKNQTKIILMVCFVAFLLTFVIANQLPFLAVAMSFLIYLSLGHGVLRQAISNIKNGNWFDENFLMSIATIGAFIIGEYKEAVGVMLFYRVGEYFEAIAVEKSRREIMQAVDLRPEVVNKVHGHHTHTVPCKDVNEGDILLVKAGERIPLDASVWEGSSRVDTAQITGEPIPVSVKEGDLLYSGYMNLTNTIKVKVEKRLEDSMVSKILDAVEHATMSKPKIDRFITKFARIYTPIIVMLALLTAIVPSVMTGEWKYWIYTAISFLVISCPCALVLSVPLAYFAGIGTASKSRILFKGGLSMEAMKHIKAVVFDKTGTITEGNFEVQECIAKQGTIEELVVLAASAEQVSNHPIAKSIVEFAERKGYFLQEPGETEEIAGQGIVACIGKDRILCGNRELMKQYQVEISESACVRGTEVLVAKNSEYLGYIHISDTIKQDAKDTVDRFRKMGMKTIMLTGDEENSANKVAKEVGVERVFAKLLPKDKLDKLIQIRKEYGGVMFVGDGMNDAPVLAGADVGVAMGSGMDAAVEAADVVLMRSNMEDVFKTYEIAQSTNRIAVQNIVLSLVIKFVVILLGLLGFANMWMAVFADTGVAMICIFNSIRILRRK